MLVFAIAVFVIGVSASLVWVSNMDLPLDQSLLILATTGVLFALLAIGIAT